MRLDNFDLNLLIALDVLLEEQSVTRAAQRLNLTQSAVSAALARLRLALKDELFIPHGKKMIATPHARALAPRVAEEILRLRALVSGATVFDPATSDRKFDIAASDYVVSVLISPLLPALKREAPGIGLNISLPTSDSRTLLADGKLDFLMTPEEFLAPGHPRELLFEEEHVVVGCRENPVFGSELTEEAFFSCGHVSVRIAGTPTYIESILGKTEDRRRIEIHAASFTMVPWFLPGTNLLALMHRRLARVFEPLLPLRTAPSPIAIPIMREAIQYHGTRASDAGLQWLLGRIRQAARADPSV